MLTIGRALMTNPSLLILDEATEGLAPLMRAEIWRVIRLLKASGADVRRESVNPDTTTDFSSLAARVPSNTQVVYVPWQLAPKAQLFGQQLRAAGRTATLFGSDGLFDPDNFKIPGSYVSFFPIDLKSPVIAAHQHEKHSRS